MTENRHTILVTKIFTKFTTEINSLRAEKEEYGKSQVKECQANTHLLENFFSNGLLKLDIVVHCVNRDEKKIVTLIRVLDR